MSEKQKPKLVKDDKFHPVYLNENDHEVETDREELFDFLGFELISRIENLTRLLPDDSYGEYGFICEALLNDGRRKLEAAYGCVESNIGEIYIDTPMRSDKLNESIPIGAILKTKKEQA